MSNNQIPFFVILVFVLALGGPALDRDPEHLEPERTLQAEKPLCAPMKIAFASAPSIQETESKDFEEIERQLQHLLEELKKLEKETEEKWRKEILPYLRREIEKLRKWLREFHGEEDTPEPIQT